MARHCPKADGTRLHERDERGVRRHRLLTSRAPATPARTASRFPVAASDAEAIARALLAERGGQADRPWRARLASPRGRAAALRPRPRRDHFAGRSRPRLRGRQAPAHRRRLPRAARAMRELANGPARKRVRHPSIGTRAGARRRGNHLRERRRNRHRDLRRLRRHRQRAGRHGLRRDAIRRTRNEGRDTRPARRRARRDRAPCLSSRTATSEHPADWSSYVRYALHQGTRMGAPRRRHRHDRHHRLRGRPARRRGLRRAAGGRARR